METEASIVDLGLNDAVLIRKVSCAVCFLVEVQSSAPAICVNVPRVLTSISSRDFSSCTVKAGVKICYHKVLVLLLDHLDFLTLRALHYWQVGS